MKKYILIAGVNGAGKSTLYQTLESLKDMSRINADVERRYIESFDRLKEIISLCDLTILYDNTENFNRFAIYQEGKLFDLSDNRPGWYNELYI